MLNLSRKHVIKACEDIDVWGYKILSSPKANTPGVAVTLPPSKVGEFVAAMARILTGEGREDDADDLTFQVINNPKGRAIAATWPGAVLTD
jgi:hypothetical protein